MTCGKTGVGGQDRTAGQKGFREPHTWAWGPPAPSSSRPGRPSAKPLHRTLASREAALWMREDEINVRPPHCLVRAPDLIESAVPATAGAASPRPHHWAPRLPPPSCPRLGHSALLLTDRWGVVGH